MLVLVWSISALRSFPKGSKAASLLLYNLWNDKNLQAAVKKVNYICINFGLFLSKPSTCLHGLSEAGTGSL